MLIQIVLLILMAVIGYLNYCLSKSYWFHEGVWGKDVGDQ